MQSEIREAANRARAEKARGNDNAAAERKENGRASREAQPIPRPEPKKAAADIAEKAHVSRATVERVQKIKRSSDGATLAFNFPTFTHRRRARHIAVACTGPGRGASEARSPPSTPTRGSTPRVHHAASRMRCTRESSARHFGQVTAARTFVQFRLPAHSPHSGWISPFITTAKCTMRCSLPERSAHGLRDGPPILTRSAGRKC